MRYSPDSGGLTQCRAVSRHHSSPFSRGPGDLVYHQTRPLRPLSLLDPEPLSAICHVTRQSTACSHSQHISVGNIILK